MRLLENNTKLKNNGIASERNLALFYYPPTANTVQITYGGKPVCPTGRRAHAKLSYSPSFIDKFIDYSSWMLNVLLDVLVYSIAVYFYSLWARQNAVQLVKYTAVIH